jgi:hypothetical protein
MANPFEFKYKFKEVIIRKAELNFMLKAQEGAVGLYLKKRGTLMMEAARKQVGVDTGNLRSSIHMRQGREVAGQKVTIGSDLSYALAHHEGTRPHIIVPNEANILRFSSGGRVIYTHKVNHPGTKPNKYLSDQLWMVRL